MTQNSPGPMDGLMHGQERSHWIRLRTQILLRWAAIFGQLSALWAAQSIFDLQIHALPCYLAIGVSALSNIIALFIFPMNKRLSGPQIHLMLVFDLLQLAFLLFMTGGLNNPFALLLLGPVTISASVMGLWSTTVIGTLAILLVTLLMPYHLPLMTATGLVVAMPDLFLFGNWAAIVIAILFIGVYSYRINAEIRSMSDALVATQMALAREQKLTDLGGVVAAAAHELGTPLATIKLTSAELIDELEDHPDLRADANLIRDQADRCRDILRSMGRIGKDDLHMRQTPASALIDEAAEPHMDRGKLIHISEHPMDGKLGEQPSILRKPEIIHGLRNLIQNAVDFARGNVWVEIHWNKDHIWIRISDDGAGFSSQISGRLGDPFMRRRPSEIERSERPGYDGMGLGLFIAKTLLERSGAKLSFANAKDSGQDLVTRDLRSEQSGAVVLVKWPRAKVDAETGETPVPRGENRPIQI
ncbi:MAG: ActS/PrrB/RegB family redox-sensitive histidine kinase [Epibacterium sp.]|nr:ActS/PrrB/RegB family redox-sensitive histidine kinase [Epibacterium sp.]NQX72820.1 ActS/PrrB/RegB family redox-sensitive histidine kinase [Epibacterium sp.]